MPRLKGQTAICISAVEKDLRDCVVGCIRTHVRKLGYNSREFRRQYHRSERVYDAVIDGSAEMLTLRSWLMLAEVVGVADTAMAAYARTHGVFSHAPFIPTRSLPA